MIKKRARYILVVSGLLIISCRAVRVAPSAVPQAEHVYVARRLAWMDAPQGFPRIALCISGGGVRAMVGGLGFLQGLQEKGLLDSILYIGTLSGSTWALSGLLESGQTLAEYTEFLKGPLQEGFLSNIDVHEVINELLKKVLQGQPLSLVDIWGSLIAQKILVNPQKKKLAQITLDTYYRLPDDGSSFIPLYNCAVPLPCRIKSLYWWVEWSPFAIRSPYLGTMIPPCALGRTFKGGESIDSPEPFSLSFCQGVWGSVISANAQDILRLLILSCSGVEREVLQSLLKYMQDEPGWDDVSLMRPFPATIPNWNYDLPDASYAEEPMLTMVDAGFLCNNPLIPFLDPERKVDILIVVDLSLGEDFGDELECIESYAALAGLGFPPIDYRLINNVCSVHGLQRLDLPTLIYFPLVANKGYQKGWNPQTADFTGTFNLVYTPAEFDLLKGLLYTAACEYASLIEAVIAQKMDYTLNLMRTMSPS